MYAKFENNKLIVAPRKLPGVGVTVWNPRLARIKCKDTTYNNIFRLPKFDNGRSIDT